MRLTTWTNSDTFCHPAHASRQRCRLQGEGNRSEAWKAIRPPRDVQFSVSLIGHDASSHVQEDSGHALRAAIGALDKQDRNEPTVWIDPAQRPRHAAVPELPIVCLASRIVTRCTEINVPAQGVTEIRARGVITAYPPYRTRSPRKHDFPTGFRSAH